MKDKNEEKISKVVLDWLTNIVTFITILAGILSVFLPDTKYAEKYAWAVFIPLSITSAIFIFVRYRRAQQMKIPDTLEPLASTAALRGLLPFEEGDQLPGRGRDIQDLYTLVSSRGFQFGVLWGESGCGKTSVLRAGLIPKLREGNFLPLYISKPTKDPLEAIRAALVKGIPNIGKGNGKSLNELLKSAAPKGSRIIILFDQFEEFFLTNRTVKSRTGFVKWLGETIHKDKLPVSFLIGIRSDFFAQLQNFAPQIPEPTSIHTSYQLRNFDSEQAKQIFLVAAKADGIPFEPELIQAVIGELEVEEFVRPAELQVVGTRLKRKNIVTLNKYEIFGGARGILSSYINDEIKQSPNEQAARLILRLMCADAIEAKSPTDLSVEDVLHRVRGAATESEKLYGKEEVQKTLDRFVNARVLVCTEENKYNLAHDYLASYVRAATEGVETSVERANRLLKRYVAEYKEDSKARIPYRHLRQIGKYASTNLKEGNKAREVIHKSKNTFYSIVATPLVSVAMLYLFLASSYYFSFDNEGFLVLRQGYPKLELVPGFDQIVIQTEYTEDSLKEGLRDEIIKGEHTGLWFLRNGNLAGWGMHMDSLLKDEQEILRLIDTSAVIELLKDSDPEIRSRAEKTLRNIAILTPERITPEVLQELAELLSYSNVDVSSSAEDVLVEIVQTAPEQITLEFAQELVNQLPDSDGSLSSAAVVLGKVAEVVPQLITPEIMQKLTDLFSDSNTDVGHNEIFVFGEITQTSPERITPEVILELVTLLSDTDPSVRSAAARTAGYIAQNVPEQITPELVQRLTSLLTEDDTIFVLTDVVWALEIIVQTSPELATPEVVQALMDVITSNILYFRTEPVSTLNTIAEATPELITPETVQELTDLLSDSNTDAAYNASGVLSHIAQVAPERIRPDIVQKMIDFLSHSNLNVRSITATTLGEIAQVAPERISPEIVQELKDLLSNNDEGIRQNAAFVLSRMSQVAPERITPDVVQELHKLLFDNNLHVRINAISVFDNLAQTVPESITLDVLIDLFSDRNIYVRASAAKAIGKIAQAAPERITPEILQKLVVLLFDSNNDVRAGAAVILGNIAEVTPERITPEVVQELTSLLSDSDEGVRSSAMEALVNIAQSTPERITPEVVEELTRLLSGNDEDIRSNAMDTLGNIALVIPERITPEVVHTITDLFVFGDSSAQSSAERLLNDMAQAAPEYIVPEIMKNLMELFSSSDDSVRASTGEALGKILETFPEYITQEIVQELMDSLSDSYAPVRSNIVEVFGEIARVAPERITPEVVQRLTELISDENVYVRSNVAETLGKIAQANSARITPDIMQKLIELLSDSEWRVRSSAANALGEIAQAAPEYISPKVVQKLISMLSDSDSDVRSHAASALGNLAETNPSLLTPETLDGIFALLKSDTSAVSRNGATYALFEIALGNKDLDKVLRDRLLIIQDSSQPHWRINASRTLDMLSICDLTDRAYDHPEELGKIKMQLETISELNEYHLTYAAQIALQELEEDEVENL